MQNEEKDIFNQDYWGKLTSLNPQFDNINLYKPTNFLSVLQNERNDFQTHPKQIDLECKIYQGPDGEDWIENLKDTNVLIKENHFLSKGKPEKLRSGDKLSFSNSQYMITFVFSIIKNSMKSDRPPAVPENLEKQLKLQNYAKTDLTCSICFQCVYRCVSLIPCLHNCCASCLLIFIKDSHSQVCPQCGLTFYEFRRNAALNNIAEELENILNSKRQKKELDDTIYQNKIYIQKFEYANGDIYQGYFRELKREGKGKLISRNDDVYQGDFLKNFRHGKGRTIFADGEIHQGNYEKDIIQGFGKYFYNCGDRYEGYFANGVPSGKGKYTSIRNFIRYLYDGEFKAGIREGKGILTSEDGGIFEGNFQSDAKEGKGKNIYPNGDVYQGNYQNDMRDGIGKMQYIRGDIYEGEFKSDFRDGFGKYTFLNGDILQGLFENGSFKGEGRMSYINGNVYEGTFSEFLEPQGYGKLKYADGSVYEGRFRRGKRDGYGKLTSSAQGNIVIEGIFKDDKIDMS